MQPPRSYLVSARNRNDEPVHLRMDARSPGDALLAAQELFPQHLISAVALQPDWGDEPA
jgi:hypothetical protein